MSNIDRTIADVVRETFDKNYKHHLPDDFDFDKVVKSDLTGDDLRKYLLDIINEKRNSFWGSTS